MTKQEVLDAIICMNCYQDEEMCRINRDRLCRPMCKDCIGYDNAMQIINDFVDLMADRLDDAVVWHPYPEETPPHYGEYLVTASDDMMERTSFIDLWHYCKNDEFQKVGYMLPPETHVIAWAEMPRPYEIISKGGERE